MASAPTTEKGWFLSFLNTTGGTALIGVLLAGIATQVISCNVQNRLRERDFNDTWLKARGELALQSRKDFRVAQRAAFEEIIASASRITNASEEFLYVTSPAFSVEKLAGNNRKMMVNEREKLRIAYRDAEAAWAPQQLRFDYLVAYFGQKPEILRSWTEAKNAVDAYRTCVSEVYGVWYMSGQGRATFRYSPSLCGAQKASVSAKVIDLGVAFSKASEHGWEGWENPEALKRRLDSAD